MKRLAATFSVGAFLIALGQLLEGIGSKNLPQVYASITALSACLLPSVLDYFKGGKVDAPS